MEEIKRFCCKRHYSENDILFRDINKFIEKYSAIVIDVRSVQEYNESHYNGAINIPVWDITKKINKVINEKDKYIIVYCSSGIRSKRAQKELKRMGFENVYNVGECYI